jgi:hypothetical protein
MTTDETAASKLIADPEPTILQLPRDLESRITTRRAEIIAKLVEIRADARTEAVEARSNLKAKLSELGHLIKVGVVDSWANLGELTKQKLEHWLASSREGHS